MDNQKLTVQGFDVFESVIVTVPMVFVLTPLLSLGWTMKPLMISPLVLASSVTVNKSSHLTLDY